MIPTEHLPQVGVCGRAGGLSLRDGAGWPPLESCTGLLVGEETAREALELRPMPRVCLQPLCCAACRSLFLWGQFVSAQVADSGGTGCMPGTVLANLILTMALWLPPRAVRLLMSLESNWLRPQSYCVQSWNLNPRPWPAVPESGSWPQHGLPLFTCTWVVDALGALALLLGAPWCPGNGIVQTGSLLPSWSLSLLQFIEETKVLSFLRLMTRGSGKEQGLALTSLGSNLSPAGVAWAVTGPLLSRLLICDAGVAFPASWGVAAEGVGKAWPCVLQWAWPRAGTQVLSAPLLGPTGRPGLGWEARGKAGG
ncbi:uncharacterized protein LOC129550599 [Moschus berezovskii]|uniref:uncharacterized protein LOC129550599 n=1 Tax=Moschus berezovskii TaxID=68408 RepID=UPI002443752B|nr:uncharacterized protein LOC129550599 [Moschus berezovskii]